jgi:hypothetical protein
MSQWILPEASCMISSAFAPAMQSVCGEIASRHGMATDVFIAVALKI